MGFYEFVLKIVEALDLPTIIAISIIGFFLYDRAVKRIIRSENKLNERINQSENRLNERINQLENNLKDLLTATIKPIQEQVYNHIPTQIKALEEKFDRKFDTLYELLLNKGKDVKKEHTKNKERP